MANHSLDNSLDHFIPAQEHHVSSLPDDLIRLGETLRNATAARTLPHIQFTSALDRKNVLSAVQQGEKLLAGLKSYHNAATCIALLPDELLSEILHLTMKEHGDYGARERLQSLMQVSRHWRNVISSDGRLWTWFREAEASDWTPVREARSKAFPLSLRIYTCKHQLFFERNAHRIAELEILSNRADLAGFFRQNKDLPLLKKLAIDLSGEDDHTEGDLYILPSFVVDGRASPMLHELKIISAFLSHPNDIRRLKNLTHLVLERDVDSDVDSTNLPSMQALFEVLSQSPQLQLLKLRHYVSEPISSQDIPFPPQSIYLASLKDLDLNVSVSASSDFYYVVTLSPKVRASIRAHPNPSDPNNYLNDLHELLELIRVHTQVHTERGLPTIRSSRLEGQSSLQLFFSEDDQCPNEFVEEILPLLSLTMYLATQRESRRMLSMVFRLLPLDQLQSVDASHLCYGFGDSRPSLCPSARFTAATWRRFLSLVPNEITLTIGVNGAMPDMLQGLVNAMRAAPLKGRKLKKTTPRQGRGSLPINRLELEARNNAKLDLCSLNLESKSSTDADQSRLYGVLIERLTECKEIETALKPRGRPLERVIFTDTFDGSSVTPHLLAAAPKLRELAQELNLSGKRLHLRDWEL